MTPINRNLSLRGLRTFCIAAERESFGEAADMLFVTAAVVKAMSEHNWLRRSLIDDYPPTAGYALKPKGRRFSGSSGSFRAPSNQFCCAMTTGLVRPYRAIRTAAYAALKRARFSAIHLSRSSSPFFGLFMMSACASR